MRKIAKLFVLMQMLPTLLILGGAILLLTRVQDPQAFMIASVPVLMLLGLVAVYRCLAKEPKHDLGINNVVEMVPILFILIAAGAIGYAFFFGRPMSIRAFVESVGSIVLNLVVWKALINQRPKLRPIPME